MAIYSEVDILRELIINAPKNSKLLINGFYLDTLSDKSFRKLFTNKDVPNRSDFSHYIILLTEHNIQKILDILDEEGKEFITDITHFAIKSGRRFSVISYDGMYSLQINKTHFPSGLKKLRNLEIIDIEIKFMEELNDHGFFYWG